MGFVTWFFAGDKLEPSVVVMASAICSLILQRTSEEVLLQFPEFTRDDLIAIALLMKRSLVSCRQVTFLLP